MKDTLETNLPEENGNVEEAMTPETAPEAVTEETPATPEATGDETREAGEEPDNADAVPAESKLSKDEILEKLTELVAASAESARSEIEALKQAYYKLRRNETEELKKTFLADGGEEKDFQAPADATEDKLKELLAIYKEKRAALLAEEEKKKAANYATKLTLIDKLKALTESQDDFNKLYNEFKDLQQEWKDTGDVPAEHVNELWRNYQQYTERFYDIIKINNQFRDYDFKKNLELKNTLCEAVEKLDAEPDVVSAFHQLQKLHQQWREIGPVAKELREELWLRFKTASTAINKKHQEHFEKIKAKEQENLVAKTAICEEIEQIDFSKLNTFKDWEEKNKEVIGLQEKWKTIGFAPKKANVKIFERFRAACDVYFNKKSEFYKSISETRDKNLDLKRSLCELAEALIDSTDWKEATEQFIALQKEWKTVGSVARKHSDAIWKRFISACDYFFEQKNKNNASQKSVEHENLAAKKALIEKINALDNEEDPDEAFAQLKEYMSEWNTVGYVPFKEKDKIYKQYHEAVDAQYDRLKIDRSERKMQTFRSNLTDMSDKSKNKVYNERDRLMRQYERMKNELNTYENNIGFLSVSSKGGSGLLKEMNRKIEKLKEDMELTVKKIDAIDETLE
ncbi:MAG: DUF349 domain-containing protein [Parabacteroides sp.]|nr:DUF349 domain-containing protein [Parabacteroides sp.]